MPNPVKGEVALQLSDGREFVLVMGFEALVAAETSYGKPIAELMKDAARGFLGASRAILFGALQARHPELTAGDAAAMLMSDSDAVTDALTAATEAAFPPAEGKKGVNPPQAGKTSGASGARSAKTTTGSGAKPRARSSSSS